MHGQLWLFSVPRVIQPVSFNSPYTVFYTMQILLPGIIQIARRAFIPQSPASTIEDPVLTLTSQTQATTKYLFRLIHRVFILCTPDWHLPEAVWMSATLQIPT